MWGCSALSHIDGADSKVSRSANTFTSLHRRSLLYYCPDICGVSFTRPCCPIDIFTIVCWIQIGKDTNKHNLKYRKQVILFTLLQNQWLEYAPLLHGCTESFAETTYCHLTKSVIYCTWCHWWLKAQLSTQLKYSNTDVLIFLIYSTLSHKYMVSFSKTIHWCSKTACNSSF